jgi:hypothetical protein
LFFFSVLTLAFAGLGFCFAATAFFGVGPPATLCVALRAGFEIGCGVVVALDAGVGLGFAGVAVAVGFGVAVGNSISLFAVATTGFLSAVSSCSDLLDPGSASGCFGDDDSSFSVSSADRSPAPPNHTMLSGFDEAFAATLQRISPTISATCASEIRTTFRQKTAFRDMSVLTR